MTRDEQTEQQIWELIYELLPADDADAVQRRITSDPDVARAYARIKLLSELVADGTRIDDVQPGSFAPCPSGETRVRDRRTASRTWRKPLVHWSVGVAAACLVCLAGYALLGRQSPLSSPNAYVVADAARRNAPVVDLTSPAQLSSDVSNQFYVRVRTPDGEPRPTNVEFVLTDEQQQTLYRMSRQTDAATGAAQIEVSGEELAWRFEQDPGAKIEVAVKADDAPLVTTETRWMRSPYLTYLAVDRPTYTAGDTVRYRSLTLSRFELNAVDALPVNFTVLDPGGQALEPSPSEVATERGVGDGEFELAADAAAGEYAVEVHSPSGQFPAQKQRFLVSSDPAPKLSKKIELARESYSPGDEVRAEIAVERLGPEAGPADDVEVDAYAIVDGIEIAPIEGRVRTNAAGKQSLSFQLPSDVASGQGLIQAQLADGEIREQVQLTLPIQVEGVDIVFFPEGGELVAGLPSRVYFMARDKQGRPADCRGQVVDANQRVVAHFATHHAGRGAFELTPQPGQTYQLHVGDPAGEVQQIPLPPAAPDGSLVLHAGSGVFERGQPIEFELRSNRAAPRLVVQASCRGESVGLISVDGSDFKPREDAGFESQVRLALAHEASGVIRLTVYDYTTSTKRPLAERLVYRRPTRELQVHVDDDAVAYRAGEQVRLLVRSTDQQDQPVPAMLGLAIVNEASFAAVSDEAPDLETFFYLTSSLDHPADLEDANFYLRDDDPAAARALDLLLGTQGWRRFVASDQLATAIPAAQPGRGLAMYDGAVSDFASSHPTDRFGDEIDLAGLRPHYEHVEVAAKLPSLADNRAELIEQFKAETSSSYGLREAALRSLGRWLFAGSLILILAVATLVAVRWLTVVRVWAPALVVSVILLIVGMLWMTAHVGSRGEIVFVDVAPRPASTASSSPATPTASVPTPGATSEWSAQVLRGARMDEAAESPAVRGEETLSETGTPLGRGATPHAESREGKLLEGQPGMDDFSRSSAAAPFDASNLGRRDDFDAGARPRMQRESKMFSEKGLAAGRGGETPEAIGSGESLADRLAGAPPAARSARSSRLVVPADPTAQSKDESGSEDLRRGYSAPTSGASEAQLEAMKEQERGRGLPRGARRSDPASTMPTPLPLAAQPLPPAPSPAPSTAPAAGASPESSQPLVEEALRTERRLKELVLNPEPTRRPHDREAQEGYYRDYGVPQRLSRYAASDAAALPGMTPYWNPRLMTDADGRAEIVVTLPERAASYRLQADGHAAGRIGSFRGRFIATAKVPPTAIPPKASPAP